MLEGVAILESCKCYGGDDRGTFSATLVDEETRLDTIKVTQGRFDIDWSLLD
jgi:hypothetical protein